MRARKTATAALVWTLASIAWIVPLRAQGPPIPFTEEALARGINFPMAPYPQPKGYVGQGVGFVDLDSDGDLDVVLIGRADNRVGIFENTGGGFFTEHTATSLIPTLTQQEGFAAADYNADGLLDLYITQAINTPNLLMRNNGNFTFTNVTASSNTSNGAQNSTGPTWADYNRDGWPDLFVCNYGQPKALYKNNGNGTFTNQAALLGLTASTALSFQTVWTDYDRDGDVDLYLSNDRGPLGDFPDNILWRNDSNGTAFTDVSAATGAGVSIFSMGIGAGDVDNNLYPDLYMTNIWAVDSSGEKVQYDGINPLLMNQGNETFIDQTELWDTDNRISSWAAIFFDYDNDTNKDLYVVNQFDANCLYECNGAPPCVDRAAALHATATFDPVYDLQTDPPTIADYSAAVGDVDGDGDLDLLVNPQGHRAELLINHEGELRNWVRYDIVGEHPNRFAIGANVETTAAGKTQFHEVYAGSNGYLGQNELVVHVGLGGTTTVTQAVFRWPRILPAPASTRTLTNLPANQQWRIYPPSRLCDADGDGIDHDDFVAFSGCLVAGFTPGCEMMDEDGDSSIDLDDLVACFADSPSDCNGNGTEDLLEIALDLSIDSDSDLVIDCCEGGQPKEPNQVGNTLKLAKSGNGDPVLSWIAPPSDGTHSPASSYDVFRATGATLPFRFLVNVSSPTHTDTDEEPQTAFYLVGARNSCGSSGEEPF